MKLFLQLAVTLLTGYYANAFLNSCPSSPMMIKSLSLRKNHNHISKLCNSNDDDQNVADFNTKVRLKEEIASPFRKLRYFFYLASIAGGGLGFVTTLPQLIFALQDGSGKTSDVLTNVGIDLAGVVGGIALWIKEYNDEKAKLERFSDKEMRMSNSLNSNQKTSREEKLAKLPIEIQTSLTNETETRIVSFRDLQERGQQNIVVLAGVKSFIRDALISARLEGPDLYSSENILIVPVVMGGEQLEEGGGKGFGAKDGLMTAPYIAKPAQVRV